eukprot:m.93775 g.93775  ORF g.93775 m.93775 type:complete len:101 (+) comp14710_c1_seq5:1026-1328(+)
MVSQAFAKHSVNLSCQPTALSTNTELSSCHVFTAAKAFTVARKDVSKSTIASIKDFIRIECIKSSIMLFLQARAASFIHIMRRQLDFQLTKSPHLAKSSS